MTTPKKKTNSSKTAGNKPFDMKKALMALLMKEANDWDDLDIVLDDPETKEDFSEYLDTEFSVGTGKWFFDNIDQKEIALSKLTPAERKLLGF